MPHQVTVSARIEASPAVLYAIIADYYDGHARMLPRPPFVSLEVEQGGRGAGTVVRVGIRVLGRLQHYRATISEPEPGRVLVESNDTGFVTCFTVEPVAAGQAARVTIATRFPPRAAPLAWLESALLGPFLRTLFARELGQLAALAGAERRPETAATAGRCQGDTG